MPIPKTTKSPHQPKLRDQLLSRAELLTLVPASYASIWQWMREGTFPKSRLIGKHKVCWLASEVSTWIASRPLTELKPYVEFSGEAVTREQSNKKKKSKHQKKKPRA